MIKIKMNKKNIQTSISLLVHLVILGVFLSFVSFASTNTNNTNNKLCPVDVDVVMIMDVSGSMGYGTSTTKIEAAQEAAKSFLYNLKSTDQSALVSFSTTASTTATLSNNHLTTPTSTESAIDGLFVYGATNIGDAIKEGINELNSERANSQAIKVMILLTDGKANKMTDPETGKVVGPGIGEWQRAVDYATSTAKIAADQGFKIFTIGLGSDSDINPEMLQEIADITGAQYYPAPDSSSLTEIYNQIALEVCQYGSIYGQKIDYDTEEGLSGWEINLFNDQSSSTPMATTTTDLDGYYIFDFLADGQYTVSEILKPGWVQTYPTSTHSVAISGHNNQENIDFANYLLPECNSSISGQKIDYDKEEGLSGWLINLFNSQSTSTPMATTTTDIDGYYIFDDLCADAYIVSEVQQEGWIQKSPTSTPYWQLELGEDEATTTIDFINYLPICGNNILDQGEECDDGNLEDEDGCSAVCLIEQPIEPVCGNGILEIGEECDDGNLEDEDGCSSVCLIEQEPEPEPTGGGGGGGPLSLIIFNEKIKEFYSDRVIISWFTSIKATSRVIYDTFSDVFVFDSPPNYGYASSTIESNTPANPNGVTYHEVEVTGLLSGIPYYFRVVSQASPEKVGQELGLTLPVEEEEEEKEEEETVQPVEQVAPPKEEAAPVIAPAPASAEEEEVEEESVFEEEIILEEVTQKEEEEETGTFLAAMAGLFTGGNFCWILTLIITALIILYLLTRRKKKQEKEIKKRYGDLIIAIIILIILIFLIKCYLLIIPILILAAYLCYEAFFKEDKD